MTERKISPMQLSMLLTISIAGSVLSQGINASDILAYPLGMVSLWIVLIPLYLLSRKQTIFTAASRLGKLFLLPIIFILLGFSLLFAAQTLDWFSSFMTSTVYPAANRGIFLLSMAFVCAYGAGMGLEPLARLSLSVLVLTVIALVSFAIGTSSMFQLSFLRSAFSAGFGSIPSRTLSILSGAGDALLFLILLSRVRDKQGAKSAAWGLGGAGLFTVIAALLVTATLGTLSGSFPFPLYTVASVAHISPQGRMDLLYLFLFVFSIFTRASLWLYSACLCLRRLFPHCKRGLGALLCAIAIIGISIVPAILPAISWILSGIPVLLSVALPLLLLIIRGRGNAS